MYELSDKTKEYLKNYDTPVDIYILAGESNKTEIFVRCLINMPPQIKISMLQILT